MSPEQWRTGGRWLLLCIVLGVIGGIGFVAAQRTVLGSFAIVLAVDLGALLGYWFKATEDDR